MIRTEVRDKLADLIAQSGTTGNADVSSYYPGDKHQTREMVFGDRTSGTVTFPYGMAEPRIQRDDFTVLFVVRIAATDDVPSAMARAQELGNAVAGILAGADLLGYGTDTEIVCDTNPDGQGIQVETREGEDPRSGASLAIAEITVPIQTQTTEG